MQPAEVAPKPLAEAWTDFLADLDARCLAESTVRKYKLLRRQIEEFARKKGLRFLVEFNLPTVSEFRGTWSDGPRSSGKKLERLRAFLRFAQRRKWVAENPASELKAPRVTLSPTMPFELDEIIRVLAAVNEYKDEFPGRGADNARRIRALVLVLRYTGMRISDAVRLSGDRLDGNRLFLYTQKTGVAVKTVLPDFVLRALEATPKTSGDYFFWDGTANLETIVGSWRKRLARLFELAKVESAHPHRFRDTFAVELLVAGIPIERVSVLLGHQSVRITERHYAPWVRARQEQLEADLASAWSRDPVVQFETQGTPEVHGKTSGTKSLSREGKEWRRGWESNPRMEVLQTPINPLKPAFLLTTSHVYARFMPIHDTMKI